MHRFVGRAIGEAKPVAAPFFGEHPEGVRPILEERDLPMRKELRQQWINAGYGEKMGSAEVVPPPPPEFHRVYHLTSAQFAIENISLGRMKVARILDLNDPYEFMSVNFRRRQKQILISDFKNKKHSDYGLLCFSQNWTNPVLWSHYGDRHRGICLGFNLARNIAEKVNYERDRVVLFDPPQGELDDNPQRKLRITKCNHWEYEQEWRVFVCLNEMLPEGAHYFCPFGDNLQLTEVIFGLECGRSLDAVRQLVATFHPNAVTFKVRRAEQWFDIVPDEKTVPCS
jgi:hypothetical protein